MNTNIEEENIDSIKLIKNNNFIYEGLLRKSILKNKEFKNELVFSLIKNDYNLLKKTQKFYFPPFLNIIFPLVGK